MVVIVVGVATTIEVADTGEVTVAVAAEAHMIVGEEAEVVIPHIIMTPAITIATLLDIPLAGIELMIHIKNLIDQ